MQPMDDVAVPPEIDYLRTGTFSGSAISLRDALARRTLVRDHNTIELSGGISAIPARVLAHSEALAFGRARWPMTATWSRHLQRNLTFLNDPSQRFLVIVQTMSAVVPPARTNYVVYTDRTALEGSAQRHRRRPNYTQGWLQRERELLRRARRVLVMGQSSIEYLIRDYGLPQERVEVVGAAPNWGVGGEPGTQVATRDNSRSQAKRLLFVGTQWELKGGPTLLTAHRILRERGHDLVLEIVGCSPLVQGDHVIMRGRRAPSEMPDIYAAADIFVLPTRFEAFGIAFVEAIMAGLPCVGTNISNIPETIGEAGLTVPADNPEALVEAIEAVIKDYPKFTESATRRGAVLAASHSWSSIADSCLRGLVGPGLAGGLPSR